MLKYVRIEKSSAGSKGNEMMMFTGCTDKSVHGMALIQYVDPCNQLWTVSTKGLMWVGLGPILHLEMQSRRRICKWHVKWFYFNDFSSFCLFNWKMTVLAPPTMMSSHWVTSPNVIHCMCLKSTQKMLAGTTQLRSLTVRCLRCCWCMLRSPASQLTGENSSVLWGC